MQHSQKYFRFGPVRQETGSKHVRLGDLLVAKNVRQTAKSGVYAKRKGFARTAQTFVGGSLSGAPTEILPGDNGNTFMRDASNQIWERSQTTNAWTLLGTHQRPWMESTTLQSNLYTIPQPFSCVVGANVWSFALQTNKYEFTIYNTTTGEVLYTKTSTTATGIVHASAAYDGTYVWVFWVDNGANGTVRCHRYTPATPKTAPVATNYYTFPSSPTNVSTVALQQVQARYLSSISQVLVIAGGGSLVSTTFKRACMHSVLDPATGLAVAAGGRAAAVSYAYSGTSGTLEAHYLGGLCIFEGQDGSGTYLYYGFTHGDGVAAQYYSVRIKVTTSTFATFTSLNFYSGGVSVQIIRTLAGYVDNTGNGKQWIIMSTKANAGPYPTMESYIFLIDNVTTTQAAPATSPWLYSLYFAWCASGLATIGGKWYFLTGYDDRLNYPATVAETSSTQRCYHLREFVAGATVDSATANIIGQVLVGDGPANWHRYQTDFTYTTATPVVSCVPPLLAVGTSMWMAGSVRSGVTGYVDMNLLKVDTAKVYGKGAQSNGRGYFPGNIPVTVGNGMAPHETTPLLNPDYLTVTGGSGTDFSIAAVCFAIYDQDGTVWRSSPKVVSQTIGNGATITVPLPWYYLGTTNQVNTEIYLGVNGTAKLQKVIPPATGGTFSTFTTPTLANQINGEVLYTTGNALSNTWPVPCQTIGAWNNRLFFAQKNRVWVSKEIEQGFGPLFNEVQISTWNEEGQEITAIAPVDWNYLAIFSKDQTAVLNGAGPDGVGSGNYSIKTLPTYTGVAAGSQAIMGAQGCYYQNPATGRIMVVTPSLQVVEGAGGAYDYAGYTFSAACWYESENLMLFLAPASNAAIVIDYQHPQEVAPFGQVYLWTLAAAAGLSLVCRDDYGLLAIDTTGHVHRPAAQWTDDRSGGTDAYQMDIITAPLQLADLQGEITVSTVQALLTMRGASGVSIGTYPNYASLTASDPTVTTTSIDLPAPINDGDAENVGTRPPNCARIQAVNVRILEKAGVTSQSFEFEGLAIYYSATGRALRPRVGRII